MPDAEHHVVYKAVADFSSLYAEVVKAKAAVASLNAESRKTGGAGGGSAAASTASVTTATQSATRATKEHTAAALADGKAAEQNVLKSKVFTAMLKDQVQALEKAKAAADKLAAAPMPTIVDNKFFVKGFQAQIAAMQQAKKEAERTAVAAERASERTAMAAEKASAREIAALEKTHAAALKENERRTREAKGGMDAQSFVRRTQEQLESMSEGRSRRREMADRAYTSLGRGKRVGDPVRKVEPGTRRGERPFQQQSLGSEFVSGLGELGKSEGSLSRFQLIVTAIVTGLIAAIPLIAVAAGGIGAFAAAVTAAAGVTAVFALAAIGNFKQLKTEIDDVVGAGAPIKAQYAEIIPVVQQMQASFRRFTKDTQGDVFAVFIAGMNVVIGLLPRLTPLAHAAAGALQIMIGLINGAVNSSTFQDFLKFLGNVGPQAMVGFTRGILDVGEGLAKLVMSFQPLVDFFLSGFQRMAAGFKTWASSVGESQGFQEFINYVVREGPKVGATLNRLGAAVINIGIAFAPLGEILLGVIRILASFIAWLDPRTLLAFVSTVLVLVAAVKTIAIVQSIEGMVASFIKVFPALSANLFAATGAVTTFGRALTLLTTATVVGVVITGLVSLFAQMGSSTDKAAVATQGLTTDQQALADALKESNGVIDEHVKRVAAMNLDRAGLLQAGQEAAITPEQMVAAYTGSKEDWEKVVNIMKKRRDDYEKTLKPKKGDRGWASDVDQWAGLTRSDDEQKRLDAMNAQVDAVEKQRGALEGAEQSYDLVTAATKNVTDAINANSDAIDLNNPRWAELKKQTSDQQRLQPAIDALKAMRDAVRSYGDAQLAEARTRRDVGDQELQADRALVEANRGLANAQKDTALAQTALTQARIDATRHIEDQKNALRDLADNEEGARLAVERAQEGLRKARANPGYLGLNLREAQLALDEAQHHLADQLQQNDRTKTDATRDINRGVEGTPSVIAAKRSVDDAAHNEIIANQNVQTAIVNKNRAYADGQQSIDAAVRSTAAAKKTADDATTAYYLESGAARAAAGDLDKITEAQKGINPLVALKVTLDAGNVAAQINDMAVGVEAVKLLFSHPDWTAQQAWESAMMSARKAGFGKPLTDVENRLISGDIRPGDVEKWKKQQAKGSAAGGPIHGPGTSTSDSIAAWLSAGEHVWTAAEVVAAGGHEAVKRLRAAVLASKLVIGHDVKMAIGGAVAGNTAARTSPVMTLPSNRSVGPLIPEFRLGGAVGTPNYAAMGTAAGPAPMVHVDNSRGDVHLHVGNINNPVPEKAGDSLYRTVRKLAFEFES